MNEEERTVRSLQRARPQLRRVIVHVVDGPERGKSVELLAGQSLSVGTSTDNALQLQDLTISRYHVELKLDRAGIRVNDLESMNGTFIGDVRVYQATVSPGTRVTLGSVTLALDLPSQSSDPSTPPPAPELVPAITGSWRRAP